MTSKAGSYGLYLFCTDGLCGMMQAIEAVYPSCASLLLANGVPMKQIQEWLGHSDFSTTANIYAHLDYSSKLTSADAMLNGLGLAPN